MITHARFFMRITLAAVFTVLAQTSCALLQVSPTQTPYIIVVTATPLPPTPTPMATQTPYIIVVTATAPPALAAQPATAVITTTAGPSVTPPGSNTDPAPALFDPPDGRTFGAKNTILRWNSDHDLNSDEVFDVLVWPENTTEQTSIGGTRDKIFPIDFTTWKYKGMLGKFFWTVRIKRLNGTYLSGGQQFSFVLTEPPGPPAPPASTPKPKPYP